MSERASEWVSVNVECAYGCVSVYVCVCEYVSVFVNMCMNV